MSGQPCPSSVAGFPTSANITGFHALQEKWGAEEAAPRNSCRPTLPLRHESKTSKPMLRRRLNTTKAGKEINLI
jgi:hypothetical protein